MKNFILFFPSQDSVSSAFEFLSEHMALRENQMLACIPQDAVNIYMVRSSKNFFGKNEFLPQFQLVGNTWEAYPSEKHVFGDLVYGFRMPPGVTHTKGNKIKALTKDKTVFEKTFPDYCINSLVCNTYEEICEKFSQIGTKLKVLKPRDGSRSKGIFIQNTIPKKEEIDTSFYPYLLQEFFDTSGGFYEYSGMHDFRIVILGGEIVGKYLRQPELGKYTANRSRGGSMIDLQDWKIPEEIMKIIRDIDSYCKKLDEQRYYSIDFGIGPQGQVKVFEMNSAPGLTTQYLAEKFGTYLAKNILKV